MTGGTQALTSHGMHPHLIVMWRIVLDTSVLVAASRSRNGASAAILGLIADGVARPLVSIPLFLEYEAVLKREAQTAVSGMTLADVDRFLRAVAHVAEGVDIHFRWRPQTRDPGDELVLEAAINGRADMLVTHNIKDFAVAERRFGIPALTPGQALARIRT